MANLRRFNFKIGIGIKGMCFNVIELMCVIVTEFDALLKIIWFFLNRFEVWCIVVVVKGVTVLKFLLLQRTIVK